MAGGRLQTNANISEPVPNAVLVQCRNPLQTVYIQKIVYNPLTIIAGTVLGFIDSITGQSIGTMTIMPASIAQTPYVVEFGAGDTNTSGTPLSKGASLILSVLAGGVNGRMHVKAYQLPLFINIMYVAPHTAGSTNQSS